MAYVKTTDFLSKDTLSSGNPLKIVKGSEIDTEFNAIALADALNLKKDGSVTPTANLPMGNFKITGLPPATGTGEAVRYDEFNGHIVDTTDAHIATAIGNTPAGGISATTVQAAINELDTEKAALAGANFTGAINEARGTVAMHATTMDIWAQPNIIDGTGSAVTITAIANAPQAGARRTLYPVAGTTITNGATFAVDGAANYTTAAGDALEFEAVTTSTYKVHIVKKDGTAVVGGGAAIQGAFKNLAASATGTTANITVTADEIAVESTGNTYQTLRAVSLTIAGTTTGANALDTGTIAASTWYSVWVIWNGTTTAGLLSLSATAPTMPSGYTHKARIGWIRTDGTANKYPLSFKQQGRKINYVVAAGSNVTSMPAMASGTAGSASVPTWVAVAAGNYAPSTAAAIDVVLHIPNGGGGANLAVAAPNNSYGAYNSTTNPPPMVNYSFISGSSMAISKVMILETTSIYWAAVGAYLYAAGWEDNL